MTSMKKVFLATMGLVVLSSASHAQTISVTVNDEPLAFAKQGPVQMPDGTIMVPIREIFERLGASVQFLPSTRTIAAVRGSTSIALQVGEAVGYVNGKPKGLAVPAQNIGGATMVPLRFISEAFGALVKWNANTHLVSISLPGAKPVASTGVGGVKPPTEKPIVIPVKGLTPEEIKGAGGGTTPLLLPKTGALVGTLTQFDPTGGKLTVQPERTVAETLSLAPDAVVLAQVGEAAQTPQALASLKPGDLVQIKRDSQGRAQLIEVRYEERLGTIKSLDSLANGKSWIVGFTDGPAAEVDTNATILRQGSPITFNDLKVGDRVALRLNPTTKRANVVTLATAEVPVPGKVEILKISHNTVGKWVKAGETITFTVTGTAQAKGTLRVPNLAGAEGLPLIETSPGSYLATLTIPAGVTLKEGIALASLTREAQSSPTIASNDPLLIDSVGPTLGMVTPPEGAEVTDTRPTFGGQFSDQGSGIDILKTQLFVNGDEVTRHATLSESGFSYQAATNLPLGKVTAKLIARDRAGNETSREWVTTLVPSPLLKSVFAAPVNQPLNFGDIITVKAEGAPGSKATFALGPTIKDLPLTDDGRGTYVGTYTIRKTDSLVAVPVTVTVTDSRGQSVSMTAPGTITITAGAPDTPIIDLPQSGASVGNSVVISGRAQPGAKVRLVIRYSGKRAGLLNALGLLGEYTVQADTKGHWATPPIALKVPKELTNLQFTADVSATSPGGKGSGTATVKFKK